MLRTALLFCLIVLSPALAFAEPLVVIAATSDDKALQPGAILETGTHVDLPKGSSLTLLSQGGQIVKLDGPLSKSLVTSEDSDQAPERKWTTALSTIADVVSKKVERSNVVGSSRDTDTPLGDAEPDFWVLTVDSSGHRCLHSGGSDLWRKNASERLLIDLRSQEEQAKGLIWDAGANRMKLPQKFVKDGTLVVMKVDQQPRRFNIHVLPDQLSADRLGDVLHWMFAKGCNRQAGLLVSGVHNGRLTVR